MKITSIQFFDYRAFFNGEKEEYLFKTGEKNLLIYGENGSGKTSFFRGIKDFVYGNDFIAHNQTTRLNEGFIEIKFSDGSVDRLDGTGSKPIKAEVLNTTKLDSFLSYKELLKTYLFESEDSDVNFFPLLVKGVLKDHTLASMGSLKAAWEKIKQKNLLELLQAINESVTREELSSEEANEQSTIAEREFSEGINKFSDELNVLLNDINGGLKRILKYFNQNLDVQLELEEIRIPEFEKACIRAKVKYFNSDIPNHHNFLNEARLSALALSIYLAAIKSNPTNSALKILLLDDVFIGLDMSNRIPLLNILMKEFSEWQIFLTTYDRHWFEVAKAYLKNDWLPIEMYVGKNDGQQFEHPVIVSSDNYFEKAKKYFNTKDYPASLNYLRKELERLIKERLLEESVRNFESRPHALSHLWEVFISRYAELDAPIDEETKHLFNTTRLVLLNPQSHDSLHYPIYEYELTLAFELVGKISAIPVISGVVILAKGTELQFKHPIENYTFTFELLADWRLEMKGETKVSLLPKCRVKTWQFNNLEFWDPRTSLKLADGEIKSVKEREDKLDKVLDNLSKMALSGNMLNFEQIKENTKAGDIWTIKELMDKINSTDARDLNNRVSFWTKIKNCINDF